MCLQKNLFKLYIFILNTTMAYKVIESPSVEISKHVFLVFKMCRPFISLTLFIKKVPVHFRTVF